MNFARDIRKQLAGQINQSAVTQKGHKVILIGVLTVDAAVSTPEQCVLVLDF